MNLANVLLVNGIWNIRLKCTLFPDNVNNVFTLLQKCK